MQLQTEMQSDSKIRVSAPPTRSDVLHACDIAEVSSSSQFILLLIMCNAVRWGLITHLRCYSLQDVAIAYGYNNITRTVPQSHTQGKQQPLNLFTDLIRAEV